MIPPMCSICSAFGHLPIHFPTKAVWKPKVNDGGVVDGEVPDNAAIGGVDLGQGAESSGIGVADPVFCRAYSCFLGEHW